MEKIIDPVSVELLKAELTPDKKLEDTNKGHNELYVVTWQDSPNVVTEIGRLREEAFRQAGGSSGLALDLDEFDKMETPYKQLVVWDPDSEAILGGYRFITGPDVKFDENGQPILATSHQFRFSEKFIKEYLPHTMELGRSFVSPEYQSSKAGAKAIFALDNLWDGLIAMLLKTPGMFYFFAKMTMYPQYDKVCRDLILYFLEKHFGDKEGLVTPDPLLKVDVENSRAMMSVILNEDDFKPDYRLLKAAVKSRGESIPPLVNSYMTTSPDMVMFATAKNDLMGNVDEIAILIPFDEIYAERKDRHVGTFFNYYFQRIIRKRFPLIDPSMEQALLDRMMERRGRRWSRFRQRRNQK